MIIYAEFSGHLSLTLLRTTLDIINSSQLSCDFKKLEHRVHIKLGIAKKKKSCAKLYTMLQKS